MHYELYYKYTKIKSCDFLVITKLVMSFLTLATSLTVDMIISLLISTALSKIHCRQANIS